MKKILKTLWFAPFLTLIHAQEVQQVVDITPDKPVETEAVKEPLHIPEPPKPVQATDPIVTTTNSKPVKAVSHIKKEVQEPQQELSVLEKLSQKEQIAYLNHKIDKLRTKNHKIRNKIHALENDLAQLKQEIKDLKEDLLQAHTTKKGE